MREQLDLLLEKYYRESGEYYSQYFYDAEDNEFDMKKDIEKLFNENKLECAITLEDGFDSCGYSNDFLAVAWVKNGKPQIYSVLLECM